MAIASVTSFDPDGDGEEHEDEVANLVDGNPSTTWRTSSYDGANFAGLKPGVGFVLVLDGPVALGELELVGTSRGFDAEVVVADARPRHPGRLGRRRWPPRRAWAPTPRSTSTGQTGGAILVWITNPTGTVVSIGDVRVTAA